MAQTQAKFQYTKAIVCGVPSSLPSAAQRLNESSGPVDFKKAVQQHSEYVRALKNLGLQVTELPPDEQHPDCVFVEDVGVVCDGVALVPRLGHPTRTGESARMKTTLQKLGLEVVEMKEPAVLDGGDVLFTGKEFFVGLTKRTTQAGLDSLAKTFPSYPVAGISVPNHLHLKSFMTMAGHDIITVGGSDEAQNAWIELEKKAKFKYKKLVVPDDTAANCLFINGTLIHLASYEVPNSFEVLNQISGPKMVLENSEFGKVDGCLTCRSILI
ncbi:hypothetical protein ACROYT_G001747 [Oculina patagonica]